MRQMHAVNARLAFALSLPLVMLVFLPGGCSPTARMGMVKDPATGLQFGSVVESSIVTDPSFFRNARIKVRIRNTSGDTAFDLKGFKREIEQAYTATGYAVTVGNDFGLLLDVNVVYSGQIQSNLQREFGFLGAATGGLAGAAQGDARTIGAGTVAGATLGAIIGSYVTDDTYIIVTRVTFGEVKNASRREGKRVTFSRSISGTFEDAEEREERQRARGLKRAHTTGISVFAGGRNTPQSEIAGQVRGRIVRIIRDVI